MKKKATIDFGSASNIGMIREENQDALGHFPPGHMDLEMPKGKMFIVADGMGGHRAGATASSMAVTTVSEEYFSYEGSSIPDCLQHAFQHANARIYELSSRDGEYSGMGTTCTALVLKDTSAYIGHIGDSRVYRITSNKVIQLTNDHSKVAEMVRRGIITKEEAKNHPERSHLYRAMGVRPSAEIDLVIDIALNTSESFLICTDGLYEYVQEEEMRQIVLSKRPQVACDFLIHEANDRGGRDNISVQVINVSYSGSFLEKLMWWEAK